MDNKQNFIDNIEYYDDNACIFWDVLTEEFFSSYSVQDISDFDVTNTFTALIGIDGKKMLFDLDLKYPDDKPVHFLEINISGEKPLMYAVYLRYKDPNSNPAPEVSLKPFNKSHRNIPAMVVKFAKKYKLTILEYDDLKTVTEYEGKNVSTYFKYFDDSLKDKLTVPFKITRF